ncbi:MAG: hypothetical protein HY862_12505 [Chloroflexi bacterium]|nr:hypothetical protein [Chloroflexota bacterium]
MGEFDQYDGQRNSNDRRRRKNRLQNYEDEADGMADAADQTDGNFANMEDYAGGFADEYGRQNPRHYRDWNDNSGQDADPLAGPAPTNPRYRRPGAPVPPLDPNQPSPALQRAAQLMDRANRRGGRVIDAPPSRSRSRSRAADDTYDDTPEQPGSSFMDMLGSIGKNLNIPGLPTVDASGIGNASKSIMVAALVIVFLLCSCLLVLTAWIISLFAS